ncbi:G-type lectin S-receptor-like serine/threonine-protein kinase [Vitis vinifera]|uniref:non-specific serine/threonine protein kinase n=1 Tax=Vitis vinifera TaxID=29760 RepID=A0A438BPP9_VITVI|nr:G-type lectin S-receptor-like serine/threonine-protein kinase [Vitis vinifera]
MKLGRNKVTGLDRYMSSWKSFDDPSRGNFTYKLDLGGCPQTLVRNGLVVKFSSGPWNGIRFSGLSLLKSNLVYTYTFIFNEKEIYGIYELVNNKIIMRLVLSPNGYTQRFTWIDHDWNLYSNTQMDDCDNYALCGVYGICKNASLGCHEGDGFVNYSGLKLPDSQKSWSNESMNLKECASIIDIREFPEIGQELYVRMATSELGINSRKRRLTIISSVSTIGIILLSLVLTLCIFKKKKQIKRKGNIFLYNLEGRESEEDLELPLFNLATISSATNNFSSYNKIGQGSFGPIYKDMLQNGKEIVVKRLSKFSIQGLDEFTNEVIYVSKLQHQNLVKLLGCCIQGEEKMLIYEYMPNKSLNYFIFGLIL